MLVFSEGMAVRGWRRGEIGDVTRGSCVFYLVQGDARRNLQRQTVVKNSWTGLSRLVVVRVPAIYPEQRPPLTTIYREPRRCVINSSARARNFKTFQASLFFHFHGESPFRTLLVSRTSLSLSPLPNEGHGGRRAEGVQACCEVSPRGLYQINPAAPAPLISN